MPPFPAPYLKLDERGGSVAARHDLGTVPQGEGQLASIGFELVPREGRGQLPEVLRRRFCRLQSVRIIQGGPSGRIVGWVDFDL